MAGLRGTPALSGISAILLFLFTAFFTDVEVAHGQLCVRSSSRLLLSPFVFFFNKLNLQLTVSYLRFETFSRSGTGCRTERKLLAFQGCELTRWSLRECRNVPRLSGFDNVLTDRIFCRPMWQVGGEGGANPKHSAESSLSSKQHEQMEEISFLTVFCELADWLTGRKKVDFICTYRPDVRGEMKQ